MRHIATEMLGEVMESSAGGADGGGALTQAEAVEGSDFEMFAQSEDSSFGGEDPAFVTARDAAICPKLCAEAAFFGKDEFDGAKAFEFSFEGRLAFKFGDFEVASGEINDGETDAF